MGQLQVPDLLNRISLDILSAYLNGTVAVSAHAGDGTDQLRLTVALHSGDSKDLSLS